MYRIEEVASFFPAFRQERDKPAVLEVRVCRDVTCAHKGAGNLLNSKTGLLTLCNDDAIAADLAKNAPGWAEAARQAPGGKRRRYSQFSRLPGCTSPASRGALRWPGCHPGRA